MLDYSPVDPVLHALSEPTRRAIVEFLAGGPKPVSAIAARLPMSLQAVMQHLAVLEAASVVQSQKVGRVRTVSLDPPALRRLEQWASDQRVAWERRLDRLSDVLGEDPQQERKERT